MKTGIDETLEALTMHLSKACPWINKAYGRAYMHKEKIGKKMHQIPKVWSGVANEYIDVRPQDFNGTMSFFFVTGEEATEVNKVNFTSSADTVFVVDVALIIWVDISKLENRQGPSLSKEKSQVIRLLSASDYVTGIQSILDQDAEEIYKEFTINDVDTQYTMLPYGGLRFNFTIRYSYSTC